jgi:hypothetical protein
MNLDVGLHPHTVNRQWTFFRGRPQLVRLSAL